MMTHAPPRFLGPIPALIFGACAYGLLWAVAPVDTPYPVGGAASGFLLLCVAAFILGIAFVRVSAGGAAPRTRPSQDATNRLFWFFMSAGAIGVGLRLYDRVVLRGVSLTGGIFEIREALTETGFNGISVIAGLLFPFTLVPLFLVMGRQVRVPVIARVAALLLFFYPAYDGAMMGGRSLAMVTLSLLVLYALYWRLLQITVRSLFLGVGVTLAAAIVATAVFESRLDEMGLGFLDSTLQSVYAYTVPPKSWILDFINSRPPGAALGMAARAYLHVTQYLTHGIYEYAIVVREWGEQSSHGWGSTMFFPYYKLMQFVTGVRLSADYGNDLTNRFGVFTTFFGPWWVDFGWFGVPLMMLGGAFTQGLWRRACAGDVEAAPLYLFLVIVIVFFPIVNLIQGAMGVYLMTALAIYLVVSRASALGVTAYDHSIPGSATA